MAPALPSAAPPALSKSREVELELRIGLGEVIRAVPHACPLLTRTTTSSLSMRVEARVLAGCPSLARDEAESEAEESSLASDYVALAKALLYCNDAKNARLALRYAQRLGADEPEFDYLQARLGRVDRESLRLCLRACRREPSYAEALYLCAQLARQVGYVAEGEQLLLCIAPLMGCSIERIGYRREVAKLRQQQTQCK